MKLWCFLFISIILTTGNVHAQALPQGNWVLYDADVLGFFYLSDGEKLIKTDLQGNVLNNYQNRLLGNITQISCFRGLKVLVYHGSADEALILDNNLAPIGQSLKLYNGGFFEIAAICTGLDGNLWIADRQTGQLLLIDQNMQVVQRGAIFTQYTATAEIKQMTWQNNRLILISQRNDMLIFDQFGTYSGKVSFKQLKQPFLSNNTLYYLLNNALLKFNITTQAVDTLLKFNTMPQAVLKSKNQLYLLKDNNIEKLNP